MLGISRYTVGAGIMFGTTTDKTKKAEVNGDGKITKNEFINARTTGISREQAQALFTQLDTDKEGFIKRSDVLQALGKTAPNKAISDRLTDNALTTMLISLKLKKPTASA